MVSQQENALEQAVRKCSATLGLDVTDAQIKAAVSSVISPKEGERDFLMGVLTSLLATLLWELVIKPVFTQKAKRPEPPTVDVVRQACIEEIQRRRIDLQSPQHRDITLERITMVVCQEILHVHQSYPPVDPQGR
jgi:hypothetical protein